MFASKRRFVVSRLQRLLRERWCALFFVVAICAGVVITLLDLPVNGADSQNSLLLNRTITNDDTFRHWRPSEGLLSFAAGEKFALVTEVSSRWHTVQDFVDKYSRLVNLERIIVVWNRPDIAAPLASSFESSVPVDVLEQTTYRVHNRYRLPDNLKSHAVLFVDDGLTIPHDDIHFAFSVWQENPDRIVGFLPHLLQTDSAENSRPQVKSGDDGFYSMLQIGASFFHSNYVRKYWSAEFVRHRDYVEKVSDCDGVLMNMLVSASTGKPPLLVRGLVQSEMDLAMHDHSKDNNRHTKSSDCINDLGRPPYFSENPLKATRYAVSRYIEIDHKTVSVGAAPGRCGGLVGQSAQPGCSCGALSAALASTAPLSATAVVTCFGRSENVARIVSMLDDKYDFIQEIVVVNNDPARKLAPLLGILRPLRTVLRVMNLGENKFMYAKYIGCISSSHPVCYFQNDDVLPTSVSALYAAFVLRPDVLHVTTDERTYSLNNKRTFFDSNKQVHTGFATLENGAFVKRSRVDAFLNEMDAVGLDETARRLSDLRFAVWANEIPTTLIGALDQSGLHLDPTSTRCDSDVCAEHVHMMDTVRVAVMTLRAHILSVDSRSFNRAFVSRDFAAYHHKAICADDQCILLTSIDLVPSLVAHRQAEFTDAGLRSQLTDGPVVPWSSLAFRHAVDGNDATGWTPGRPPGPGDFVGLDLLRGRALMGLRIVGLNFNPGDYILEVSCSPFNSWTKKAFLSARIIAPSAPPTAEGFYLTFQENSVGARAIRMRWKKEQDIAPVAPAIYDISGIFSERAEPLTGARLLFVLSELPDSVSKTPTHSSLIAARAEVLGRTGANVTVVIASTAKLRPDVTAQLRTRILSAGCTFAVVPRAPPKVKTGPPSKFVLLAASMLDWMLGEAAFDVVHYPTHAAPMALVLQARRVGLTFGSTLFVAHAVPTTMDRRVTAGRFPASVEDAVVTIMERRSVEYAQVVVLPFASARSELPIDIDALARNRRGNPAEVAVIPPVIFTRSAVGNRANPASLEETFAEAVVICDDATSEASLLVLSNAAASFQEAQTLQETPTPMTVTICVVSMESSTRLQSTILLLRRQSETSVTVRVMDSVVSYSAALRYVLGSPRRFLLVLNGPLAGGIVVLDAIREGIPLVAPAEFADIVPEASRTAFLYNNGWADLTRVLCAFLHRRVSDIPKLLVPRLDAALQEWIELNVILWQRRGSTEFLAPTPAKTRLPDDPTTPTITVCIPSHDRVAMLEAAVASVLESDYPASRLEIVVVDDATKTEEGKRSLEIVAALLKGRGVVAKSPGNGGIAARNHAARLARGELLYFFDDDDLLRPNTLTMLVNAMLSTGADVVGGWIEVFLNPVGAIDEGSKGGSFAGIHKDAVRRRWISMGGGLSACLFANCFFASGGLHRRSAFEKVGGWRAAPQGTAHQDYELYMREATNGFRLELMPCVVYDYRNHAPHTSPSTARLTSGAASSLGATGVLKSSVSLFRNRMHSLKPLLEAAPELQDALLVAYGNSNLQHSGNNNLTVT